MSLPGLYRRRAAAAAIVVFIAVPAVYAAGLVYAADLATTSFKEDFSGPTGPDGTPEGWKALEFPKIKKHTTYTVATSEDGDGGGDGADGDVGGDGGANRYLLAESSAAASGLYKEIDVDLRETPLLRWRWRVDGVLEKGDATRKEGDDYPARVYVTFAFDPKRASFFERMKHKAAVAIYGAAPSEAINYIWANTLPRGRSVPNPYSDKAMMVAVRSGPPDMAGRWVWEERNVYEDYRNLFGAQSSGEPPKVVSIAVMTDTDNTGGTARAGYDDIEFTR